MRWVLGFMLAGLLGGCRDSGVAIYRVPKEAVDPASTGAQGSGPRLRWRVPQGWTARPADGIRNASFAIADKGPATADVSVVVLAGEAGGFLSNVNRWREQLGLAPINERELASMSSSVNSPAGMIRLFDLRGAEESDGYRIVAGILPAKGNTWFFKLTAASPVAGRAKPSFERFLRSMRFDDL